MEFPVGTMPDGAAFYPKDLPHRRELEFASRVLNSIEINSSFYSLQQPTSYRRWYGATPENFLFSVKGARFITHMKKLRKVEFRWPISLLPAFSRSKKNLARFFGNSRQTSVGAWNVFARIFQLLPKSTKEAASLGRRHDSKLKARAWLKTVRDCPLRYCAEIRHPSFLVSDFFELLRKFNVAFVFADTAGKWPYAEDLTADFVYCCLHGDTKLYTSGYSEGALDWWSARLKLWRQGKHPRDAKVVTAKTKPALREVFVYFDNDAKVHAPFDAQALARKMK